MQDRFKFRLWDKAIGEMAYDVCVGFIKDGLREDWVCADTTCGQINYRDNKLKDIELMQCTGLKDKNGKLIYEGDILIQKEENGGPTKKLVIWEKDGGYLGLKDLKKSFFGVVTFHRFGYTYQVIGNIYENSELLEVSDEH